MHYTVPGFSILKALEEGQLSVQAETFYSNKLASGTVGLLLSSKISR